MHKITTRPKRRPWYRDARVLPAAIYLAFAVWLVAFIVMVLTNQQAS